jgi:predicted AlkP superfamily pyrophosphatase or phosphodiesterase
MGWFTYLRELGCVTTVLPFRPRHGGPTFSQMGVAPGRIFTWTPMADRIRSRAHVVNPAYLVASDYSRAAAGRAQRLGYEGLLELIDHICRCVTDNDERNFVHAYWPDVDALAHQFGVASPEVAEHLQVLDRAVAQLAARLAGTDTLLLVTADHGLIDTSPERTIHLDQHPELAATLTLPLCGEPRLAYCYVRPGRTQQFEDYVRGELGERCRLRSSAQLIEEGWFGPPPWHPGLTDRVGDYALLMADNWVIRDRVAAEKPFRQVGVHGGLSPAELWVPLVVVDAR